MRGGLPGRARDFWAANWDRVLLFVLCAVGAQQFGGVVARAGREDPPPRPATAATPTPAVRPAPTDPPPPPPAAARAQSTQPLSAAEEEVLWRRVAVAELFGPHRRLFYPEEDKLGPVPDRERVAAALRSRRAELAGWAAGG
eukprot:TRINITY_DN62001_c0_g1_i1.p4 TRINITY_DN62001_c0_g1~~TRINITY_DN62001_c0_g1_i1.p4  ORF type:complete len:142 (+),score=29.47 TRINITY_DN62001_c0_g1_i1:59-484(+)